MIILRLILRQVLRHLRENPLRRDEVRQRNISRSSPCSGVPALHWDEAVVRLEGEACCERAALHQIRSAGAVRALALLMPRLPAAEAGSQVALELRLLALEAAVPLLKAIRAPNVRSISRWTSRRCSGPWRCSGPGRGSALADDSRLPQRLLDKRVELQVPRVLA